MQVVWSRVSTVAAHAFMGVLLLLRARATDLSQPKSIAACYMFVWKLFYTEYLLIPLLR
jgi:homogentisate phytyltransferase / homogentisate geranylgeranyltransferase